MHGAEGGSRHGHVKSDAQRGLHHAARRTVGTLPKRRKPEGRRRSGDRGELPHAATEEFAKSYWINLRLLPELAFSFEHDAEFHHLTGEIRRGVGAVTVASFRTQRQMNLPKVIG